MSSPPDNCPPRPSALSSSVPLASLPSDSSPPDSIPTSASSLANSASVPLDSTPNSVSVPHDSTPNSVSVPNESTPLDSQDPPSVSPDSSLDYPDFSADPVLLKVIANRISILIHTLTHQNLLSHHNQIKYILQLLPNPAPITDNYYQKLFGLLSIATDHWNPEYSALERLFTLELAFVSESSFNYSTCLRYLCDFFEARPLGVRRNWSAAQFLDRYDCRDLLFQFVILVKFVPPDDEPVRAIIRKNSLQLLLYITAKKFPQDLCWNTILDLILNTNHFSFIHKLLALKSLSAFDAEIDAVNSFYINTLKMSFKELILEIGAENVLPEGLLSYTLSLKTLEVDLRVALILAEVLVPGSQDMQGVIGPPTPHPAEANARGARLQASLRDADSNEAFTIDWTAVVAHIASYLQSAPQSPTEASIIEFLLAIDWKPGNVDCFLSHRWLFDKLLFYVISSLDPSNGAYDLAHLPNLHHTFRHLQDYEPGADETDHALLKLECYARLELEAFKQLSPSSLGLGQVVVPPPGPPAADQDTMLTNYAVSQFAKDMAVCPEYFLAVMLLLQDKTEIDSGLAVSLFARHFDMDMEMGASTRVLRLMAQTDHELLLLHFYRYYLARPRRDVAVKIVRYALDLNIIESLVLFPWTSNVRVSVVFLVEAASADYDSFAFVKSKLANDSGNAHFYGALLDVLFERAQQDFQKSLQGPNELAPLDKPLALQKVHSWLVLLKTGSHLLDSEKMKVFQLMLLTTYPRLINFDAGHDEAILANAAASPAFPPDVEQEMKAYYSKMYNKEVAIKDIVDMLLDMKSSDDPHKQDVFACMIHSLLDEYRFFAEYPLSALASTSLLFGALLERDLIHGTTLTVALNFIWESCNQPHDSHMFKFAVQSLYNFKSRLHEYPIYCKHLLECRSLLAHAKMYLIVKDAANGIPCSVQPAVPAPAPEAVHHYQSIRGASSITSYVKQQEPVETVHNKLLFLANNMTSENLKATEIRQLLAPEYNEWFAKYLVLDRAKSEPNNHDLYCALVKALESPVFYEFVLNVSLREVQRIAENFKESTTERNQLKNLGGWLGKITLSCNKVLKRDHIGLKFLLVEAYDFKTLHLIIPFVCKLLEQAKSSKVFRPPNPWVLGIIKVLAELYECGDLKLNLKFEIEVLLNAFKLKVSDIEPSTLIRTHNPNPTALAVMFGLIPDPTPLSHDMNRPIMDAVVDPVNSQMAMGQMHTPMNVPAQMHMPPHLVQQGPAPLEAHELQHTKSLGGPQPPSHPQQQQQAEHTLDTSFSSLIGNSIFTQHASLRRILQAALTRAVRECAVPILTRVSEAVLTTTEALVAKDFATERDVGKLRNSYQNMAQQLSHIMVFSSGRKLLAETIESTMLLLLSANPNEVPLAELAAAIQANVGLCVEIVDKIAADNIGDLIDERMQRHVLVREQNAGSAHFIDERASKYAMNLPEPLGLLATGLTPQQMRIYDNFGTNVTGVRSEPPAPVDMHKGAIQPHAPLMAPDMVTMEQLLMAFTQSCDTAILLLGEVTETKLAELPQNHPIMLAVLQALATAQSNALKCPELLLKAAQYAVNCLFTQLHKNPMSTEIYVVILDKLCECSPSTAKDVTWWLVYSLDQRKFNIPVICSLLEVQLVQPFKLDASLSKLIVDSGSAQVVNFAAQLLAKVLPSADVRPVALRCEFVHTLSALKNYTDDGSEELAVALRARDTLFETLDHLGNTLPTFGLLYEQMGYVFSEWVKLVTHGRVSRTLQDEFVEGMLDAQILTHPEYFRVFCKAAIEISVAVFATEHEIRTRTQRETYLAIDAFATLIVRIVTKFDDVDEAIAYMQRILAIVVLNLSNDHETAKQSWNERAYFRFFSSLLCCWNDELIMDEHATDGWNQQFYGLVAETLHAVQPLIYPGFTFAWVSLVAHRMLLPRLLELPNKGGYAFAVQLLTALLKFQQVYSRNANHDVISVLFKAVNRVFAGIMHDYPEFLVECHYQLSTAVPRSYIQLRNIILSATPRNVHAPDPFTQGLKVERLPEINEAPSIAYEPIEDLAKVGLRKPIENYLRIPTPALMRTIHNGIKLSTPREQAGENGLDLIHYNPKLVNAVVLHVGMLAVAERLPNQVRGFSIKSSQVALLTDLMNHGLFEFKLTMINAICNQLRYPSSHTHWFVGIILYFFSLTLIWGLAEARLVVQELILTVLLERRLVYKPHPWGLTIVFTELVKNDAYGLFELPFVRGAGAELRAVFDTLALNIKGASMTSQAPIEAH